MDEQPSIQSSNGDDGSYYYYDYDAEIVPCNDTYLCMRRVSDTEVIEYYIRNWGILPGKSSMDYTRFSLTVL